MMIKQYCYIYKPSIDESKGLVNRLADFTSLTGSLFISAPLVVRIIHQDHQLDDCRSVQQSIKRRIQQTNRTIVPQGINCQKYKYSYVA